MREWYWGRRGSLVPSHHNHVIGVCLPSQSVSEKHNQEKQAHKPLRTSWFLKMSAMFDNQTILLFWNKPFARSAFRALFTWSRRTTCAKDHRLFLILLPTNQRGRNTRSRGKHCTCQTRICWNISPKDDVCSACWPGLPSDTCHALT